MALGDHAGRAPLKRLPGEIISRILTEARIKAMDQLCGCITMEPTTNSTAFLYKTCLMMDSISKCHGISSVFVRMAFCQTVRRYMDMPETSSSAVVSAAMMLSPYGDLCVSEWKDILTDQVISHLLSGVERNDDVIMSYTLRRYKNTLRSLH